MTDGQILFATLVALYLIECVHWSPAQAWVIRRAAGRPGRRLDTANVPETAAGVPCFVSLLPWATVHVLCPWPLAPAPEAISLGAPVTLPGTRRPRAQRKRIAYEDLAGAESDGTRIADRNRRVVIRAGSARLAAKLEVLLDMLRTSAPAGRVARAEAARAAGVEAQAFASRLALFDRHARRLRAAALVQFACMFGAAPLVVSRWGFSAAAIAVIAAVAVLDLALAALFVAAHRALRPEAKGERVLHAILVALCPTVAIRAADRLGADLLGDAHVALGAALLLERSDAAAALSALTRELDHPAPMPIEGDHDFHRDALAESRAGERRCVERVAQGLGVERAELLRLDRSAWPAEARSYCPRCLEALLVAEATCPSCAIATVAVPA